MGKKNICPRCGGPLRPDAQCIQFACRMQTSDMKTPVVEPPEFRRSSDFPTEAPPDDPDSIETLPAEKDPESTTEECALCRNLLPADGQCRNAACLDIQQAMSQVDDLNGFSDPPPGGTSKNCIPPKADYDNAHVAEPGWDDRGRCLRCQKPLEESFAHCPKCGLARPKKPDLYAVIRGGIQASLPPGVSAPPKSGFQPSKSEYSIINPTARPRRRRGSP